MSGLSTNGNISFGDAFVAGRNRVPRPAAGMTAFLTVRRDMEGYYVMGCVNSRNGRTSPTEGELSFRETKTRAILTKRPERRHLLKIGGRSRSMRSVGVSSQNPAGCTYVEFKGG